MQKSQKSVKTKNSSAKGRPKNWRAGGGVPPKGRQSAARPVGARAWARQILNAMSKKQGCTSHSTVEAEVVSLNTAVRLIGLPALDLWETIVKRPMALKVYEDSQATAKIVQSGKFQVMRHVKRTHGVQLSLLHDLVKRGTFMLEDCDTTVMAADIFTKFFITPCKWEHAILLICVLKEHLWKKLGRAM